MNESLYDACGETVTLRFLRKLWLRKGDRLRERAERLVPSASVFATSMFVPMRKQYPLLEKVHPEQWDFVLTIAGVFTAATRLQSLRLGDDRQTMLINAIEDGLVRWSPKNGVRGFVDCKAMFEQTFDELTNIQHEPRYIASDSVGWWVVRNFLGSQPSADEEERKLVRAVGVMVVHTFSSWWSD